MRNFKCASCVLGCVVTCALRADAQQQSYADSILNHEAIYNDYKEMYKSGAHLLHGDTARVGLVTLDYSSQQGNYHRSQEGQQVNQLNFEAKGVATLHKIKVSGNFLYQQKWIDSMNNTMVGSEDHFVPFYFFATKHGTYNFQKYIGQTQISYEVLPKKIAAAIGIDYGYQWMTRTVDPRPEVNTHNFKVKPELIFQFAKHNFGVKYTWGYGSDYTALKFKNSLFTQSLAYPERIFYNNQGFGFISIKDQHMRIFRTMMYQGLGLSYNYKGSKLDIHATAEYLNVYHESSQTEAIKQRDIISVFDEDNIGIDAIVTYNSNDIYTHQLLLKYNNRKGSDWNRAFNANSYNAEQEFANIAYGFYINRKPYKWYLGVGLDYNYLFQSDAATSHWLLTNRVTPKISVGNTVQTAKADYSITLTSGYTIPVQTEYSVPATQENVFSKNILYPDYRYYSTKTFQYGALVKVSIKRLVAQNSLNIFGRFQNEQSLKYDKPVIDNSTFIPSGNRWSINVGIAINM